MFSDIGIAREYQFVDRAAEKAYAAAHPNEGYQGFEAVHLKLYRGNLADVQSVNLGEVLVKNQLLIPRIYHDQVLVLCFGSNYKPLVIHYDTGDGVLSGDVTKSFYFTYKPSELDQYVPPTTTYTNEAALYAEGQEPGNKLCSQLSRRVFLNNFQTNIFDASLKNSIQNLPNKTESPSPGWRW